MEQRTVSDLVKTFEPLLRVYENDQGLRIDNALEEPGSKVGDNYMSVVVRTEVTGTRGNGAPYSATFMTKRFPRHRQIAAMVRNAELFFNEAHAYTKLLPRLGSTIGPRCLYADHDDVILEDLRPQGYVVCERMKLLDLAHCKAAIKALAILHARSLMLKLNKPEEFAALIDPLVEAAFPQDDQPSLGTTIDSSFTRALNHFEPDESTDEELARAVNFLKSYENRGYDILRDLVAKRDEKYHVLTHGDAWNNNILFRHDASGGVTDVKLIDFQIVRHCSPAIDFHYFVYSSARSDVVNGSYDELVKTYHTALIQEMRALGADESTIRDLSVEWFKGELKKMAIYGLFTSSWLVNAVLAEEGEAIDMDTVQIDFLETMMKTPIPVTPVKSERIKCIFLHYFHTYA